MPSAAPGASATPGTPADPALPGPRPGAVAASAERMLAASLWLAILPVAMLLLAALGAFAYGAVVFFYAARDIVRHPFPVGHQIGLFLLDTDLFLIGATLMISAVGFYELFIGEIRGGVPAWLEMRDLNDLKGRIIAMIIMVLAVSFVELAVDGPGAREALDLGIGVAVVIAALTAFLRLTQSGD